MEAAGYGGGFEMTIHGPNDRYINDAKIAEAIGQMLTRIGIKTAVETMPRSVYFSACLQGAEQHAGVQLHPRRLGRRVRRSLLAAEIPDPHP